MPTGPPSPRCTPVPVLLLPLLLLLLLTPLLCLIAPAAAALNPQERAAAFVGYAEGEQEACPVDEHAPAECEAWAEQGECLSNPTFMRAHCKASCRVVARCVRGMASSSSGASADTAPGPWQGHATSAGTASWAAQEGGAGRDARPAAGHFRQHTVRFSGVDSPPGNLTLSSLGVGTYLGGSDAATDEAVTSAIIKTVAHYRWNVIDTAANYRHGRAEVSVGRALQALRALGGAQRDQLFVSTKAGYPPEGLMERLLAEGAIAKADVAHGYHSMHPTYLSASLHRSLAALGLATVDLLYIHNPAESQLELLGRKAFMERLRAAFEFCEQARSAGEVRAYGIATWSCFRVPLGDRQHLSLQAVVDLAEQVGGPDHGFRYIQLPVSAGMPEAWAEPWQELRSGGSVARVTIAQAAKELGIGVFGSGPLMEAELLKNKAMAQAAAASPQLKSIQGTAPRLLQLARSTPGLLASLVGHKTPAHVDANGALSQVPPLTKAEFREAFEGLHRS